MANDNNNVQPVSDVNNQTIIYTTSDGKANVEVQIDANTVWLTQQQICLLYGKVKSTISEHLTHIFEEGELDPEVVVRENRTTTQHGAIEGKTQENITRFYEPKLFVIITNTNHTNHTNPPNPSRRRNNSCNSSYSCSKEEPKVTVQN